MKTLPRTNGIFCSSSRRIEYTAETAIRKVVAFCPSKRNWVPVRRLVNIIDQRMIFRCSENAVMITQMEARMPRMRTMIETEMMKPFLIGSVQDNNVICRGGEGG